MDNHDKIKEDMKTIERMFFIMGIMLILASIYLLFLGKITNALTTLANTLYWGAFYLIKRRDFKI